MSHPITLHLANIQELFVAPPQDVLASNELQFTGQSGLERVIRQLRPALPKSEIVTIEIILLVEHMETDLEQKVHSAIERYSALKIEENERHARVLRQRGRKSLIRGLFFLAIATALAALIRSPLVTFIPDFIQTVLSDGFTIIGWVVLWHPVEAFLYDPAELQQENEVYQFLKRLRIVLKAG